MRQRDQNDFLDQRIFKRIHGMIDELASVVERDDLHSRGKPGLKSGDLGL